MSADSGKATYKKYRPFYRRHLPHYQPTDAVVFLTFRLAGSLPHVLVMQMREEKEFWEGIANNPNSTSEQVRQAQIKLQSLFAKWEETLDAAEYGPKWLSDQRIAHLVSDSLLYRHGKVYTLYAFCIMPNHVHVLFRPLKDDSGVPYPLSSILQSLKGYTARKANIILGRGGSFWQDESFDRVIRDDEDFTRTLKYVLNNPVKAGLVSRWEDWPWSYLRRDLWND